MAPGQFQTSSNGRRTFFIDRDPEDERTGRNVFILSSEGDSESVTTAHRGRIEFNADDRLLRLERGQRNAHNQRTGEKTLARFESYEVSIGESSAAQADETPPKTRSTIDLLRQPTPALRGELAWRLGLVLGAANLLLLGIGLAYSNPRRPGSWGVLFALLGFIVYYNLITLTRSWIAAERVSLGGALLATHGGAFLLALLLLRWREHAVRRPRWRPFARRAARP